VTPQKVTEADNLLPALKMFLDTGASLDRYQPLCSILPRMVVGRMLQQDRLQIYPNGWGWANILSVKYQPNPALIPAVGETGTFVGKETKQ